MSGRVTRTPGLLDGPIPEGRSLTEILMAACARNDVVEIREILELFQRWMDGHGADGRVPGWAAFAVADNVVFDGTRFMMLDASWQLPGELDAEVVLARILRRFAVHLLDSGQWHPWSWQLGADRLTLTLLSMAGRTADPEDVRRGAELDAQIDANLGISHERGARDGGDAGQGPDQDDLDGAGADRSGLDQGGLGRDDPAQGAASLEENDPDAPDPVHGGPRERRESYRELYAARGRLRERLEEAQQKITMLERDLEIAEAKLTKLAKAVRAAKQAGRRDDKSRTPAGKRGEGGSTPRWRSSARCGGSSAPVRAEAPHAEFNMPEGASCMPQLSVVIPYYNVEKYFDECLASIQSQTFGDFEVICVDDGSMDASAVIAKEVRGAGFTLPGGGSGEPGPRPRQGTPGRSTRRDVTWPSPTATTSFRRAPTNSWSTPWSGADPTSRRAMCSVSPPRGWSSPGRTATPSARPRWARTSPGTCTCSSTARYGTRSSGVRSGTPWTWSSPPGCTRTCR